MTFKSILKKLLSFTSLEEAETTWVLQEMLTGKWSATQLTAFLIAMCMKGESSDELFAGVKVLREFSALVHPQSSQLLDIVGTGGDEIHTFNISTACAFVLAAAGVKVAKHGSTSVSSKSGSANVLEALKINIHLNSQQVAHCIDNLGIGFMFAPMHHPAMQQVAAVRRELGIRTIFNLLGPLTNPANANLQMIGVFDQQWLLPFAEVLRRLGSKHALIVHARDGMDEISIDSMTDIVELNNDSIQQYTITPEELGIQRANIQSLQVNSPDESANIILDVFNGKRGPAHDIIILNAGAALYAANRCDTIQEGVQLAAQVIETKKALEKLQAFSQLTNEFV